MGKLKSPNTREENTTKIAGIKNLEKTYRTTQEYVYAGKTKPSKKKCKHNKEPEKRWKCIDCEFEKEIKREFITDIFNRHYDKDFGTYDYKGVVDEMLEIIK